MNRNYYWDNVKACLIFFVVLGHFLLPVSSRSPIIRASYDWIYLFHMPAFVFVSGLFSKSFLKKEHKELKLTGFLVIYFVFTIFAWIVEFIFNHHISLRSLLSPSGAPWYMLSMFFWYLFMVYLSCLPFRMVFPISVLLALAVSFFPQCGDFLALSRTIVFFPFFLLGYRIDPMFVNLIRITRTHRCIGFLIGLSCFIVLLFFSKKLSPYLSIVYSNKAYSVIGYPELYGFLIRLFWFISSAVMTVALLLVIPTKKTLITYWGQRTMAIYFGHRIFRDIIKGFGIYDIITNSNVLFLVCLLLSFLVIFIFSAPVFSNILNNAFNLNFTNKHE